jgi:predicted secreted protein
MVLLALRHQMIGVWNHGFRWFADRRLRCVHCGRRVGLLLEPGGAPLLL